NPRSQNSSGGGSDGRRRPFSSPNPQSSNRLSQEQGRRIVEPRQVSEQIAGDGTDDIIVAGDATSKEDLQRLALIVLRDKREFDSQHKIRRFVNSCLMNLSNHHDVDTSSLLLNLASNNGLLHMTNIMMYPMHIDAGLRKSPASFQ